MLQWLKGIKLASIAQKVATAAQWLWNAAFTVGTGGLNLIIPAIAALAAAWWVWRDAINDFLQGAWGKFISGIQTGYNVIAGLVPGLEEVAISTGKASDAGHTFSDYLNGVGDELPHVSAALAGGAPGASLAPSADAAEEALAALRDETTRLMGVQEDELLVTNLAVRCQLSAISGKIGTCQFNDILVSHKDFIASKLAGVIPSVTSGLEGLTRRGRETRSETGETYGMKLRTGLQTTFSAENVGATIARAFEARGGSRGCAEKYRRTDGDEPRVIF